MKYITDIAPSNQDVLAEKFGNRFFATPKNRAQRQLKPTSMPVLLQHVR